MRISDWSSDVCSSDLLRAQAPDATLVALGGATEAAIWSNAHEIGALAPDWPSIPYGTPLAGHMLHVVNNRGEPCPDWVVGEIEIAGQGLARGYWRDPERTAERFRTDPATGERRYRTGDLGRRSEEHTSELQSLMRISYAVFCLKKKRKYNINQ